MPSAKEGGPVYTVIAISVVCGMIIGSSICGIMTKMNLSKARKLEVEVLIHKQEKELLKERLAIIERARQNRLRRKLQKLKNRKQESRPE